MISKHKLLSTSYLLRLLFILIFCMEQIELGNSLRVSSRKCQYGNHYTDGCVSCWCEKDTGLSVCEHMTSCPRKAVKCPMGRKYRDECDNECTCYESTGAIFCKEKGQCNSIRRRNIFELDSFNEQDHSPLSFQSDLTVPDPVYLPKDDLIIEPALIIRRKSFKPPKDYDSNPSSSQLGVHTPRKPSNTLLYLYEKQLKSMNEFRNYYRHYLHNEQKAKDKHMVAASNNNPIVRKPFINLSINIPKKYPPLGTAFKGPPRLPPYHSQPPQRPPPTSTIVYERRFIIPVTRRPSNNQKAQLQQPSSNSNPFRVTASSSTISIKATPRPMHHYQYTIRPPTSSPPIAQKAVEEYSGSTFPSSLQGLSFRPQKPFTDHSNSRTRRPFNYNQFITQKATVSEAISFYTTERPVLYSSSTGRPVLHSSTFPPMYYSTSSRSRPNTPTKQPLISVNHKAMTSRPMSYSSTTIKQITYQSAATSAPNYNSIHQNKRTYPMTRRPFVSELQRQTEQHFYTTDRPMYYSSSSIRPIDYPSAPSYTPKYYSTSRIRINSSTRRPMISVTRRPTQAYLPTTQRPMSYSSSTLRPISHASASKYAPTYYPTSRPWRHQTQKSSGSEYDYHIRHPPNLPYNGPFVHAEVNRPIRINHILRTQLTHSHRKYIPRPKQYHILLRPEDRKPYFFSDNNKVPLFVDKIARQFFRKPEIFIPKIKNGRPGLERVVFNHKEMIPKELVLEPGGRPMKVKFSPEAEEQMEKEWNGEGLLAPDIIGHGNHNDEFVGHQYSNSHSGNFDEAPKPDYETQHVEQADYQVPHQEYESPKDYQAPEFEQPIIEPEHPKSDYYDTPPTDYHIPYPNYETTHLEDKPPPPPVHFVDHHYEVPASNSDYRTSEFPDNHGSPPHNSEYVSPSPQPSFEIPNDQMDNFDHHHDDQTILFDSIQKSHEIKQNSVTLEPQYIQEVIEHRVGQDENFPAPTTATPITYSGSSSEINHDEIIRSILSMDPEIGPDAIIYKSNGETVPPNPVTVRTPLVASEKQSLPENPKQSLKVESAGLQPNRIPHINLKADSGIISFDYNKESTQATTTATTTTESPFDKYFRELFTIQDESNKNRHKKPDGTVDTEGVAKIFSYELQKSQQVFHASTLTDSRDKRNDGKLDNKTLTTEPKSTTMPSSTTIESQATTTIKPIETTTIKEPPEEDPSSSFKKELDWKSDLMSNICDVNPNSPLCYTYKSLCLLMST